jgi:signal transduction histidine kinase
MRSGVELVLFRVIQEALTNIWRHSGSKTARIRFMRKIPSNRPQIALSIEDSGIGMSDDIRRSTMSRSNNGQQTPSGLGLIGMRERLHRIGGQLEIYSETGKTVILAIVPLEPEKSLGSVIADDGGSK